MEKQHTIFTTAKTTQKVNEPWKLVFIADGGVWVECWLQVSAVSLQFTIQQKYNTFAKISTVFSRNYDSTTTLLYFCFHMVFILILLYSTLKSLGL